MLTKDERWKINHARKLLAHAENLLDECRVRRNDSDSAAVLEAAQGITRNGEQLDAIISRFGVIPDRPVEESRPRAGTATWSTR